MPYRRRVVDALLDELFPDLVAIALEEPKVSRKTATALQRAETVISLDLPVQREIIAADLDYVAQAASPVFIDEWQLHPAVWDRVRRAVDEDPRGGRYLLAGSAGVAPVRASTRARVWIVSLPMRPSGSQSAERPSRRCRCRTCWPARGRGSAAGPASA